MKKKFFILITLILILFLICFICNFAIKNNNKKNLSIDNNSSNSKKYSFEFVNFNIDYDNMKCKNLIYYKEISSFEEYKKFNKINNIVLNEDDFKNNFFIALAIENTSMLNLTLKEVFKENNTLYIGLDKVSNEENFDQLNDEILITLDNSLKASNIEVFKTIDDRTNFSSNEYKDIKELPDNYSIEQAFSDGCIINDFEKNNAKFANDFLENVNNGIDAQIRFYNNVDGNMTTISDLKYLADKKIFIVCKDETRLNNQVTYNYYEYDTISESEHQNNYASSPYKYKTYELTNSKKNEEPFIFAIYQ